MANREFIAAKDLPVTEAEEVNVLVVDLSTGELAQKAGANLGGGGSAIPDLVISINQNPYMKAVADKITFTEGSIDNVISALNEGRIPVVKLLFFNEMQSDYCYTASELIANVYRYGSELYFSYIYPMTYNGVVYNGYMRFTTDGVFEEHRIYSANPTELP